MSAPRLTLSIRNVDSLENGVPTRLDLDQRGAIIGRSATADWSLPDPRSYISSRHCEIRYEGGQYRLTDRSTNGTSVNGSVRMTDTHVLRDGDVIIVGHYEIVAKLAGGGDAPMAAAPEPPAWAGWQSPAAPTPPAQTEWGAPATPASVPPPPGSLSGADNFSASWDAPPPSPSPSPAGFGSPAASEPDSPWGQPAARSDPSSPWSSPVSAEPAAPSAEGVWGKFTDNNVVDWARGGFGAPTPAVQALPRVEPPSPGNAPAFTQAAAPAAPPVATPPPAPAAGEDAELYVAAFLAAAGIDRADVTIGNRELFGAAGAILRGLVSGLVVMMEARARAKSQLGAQSTIFNRDGNNPIKFARSPKDALTQLLQPPLGGFMPGEHAVEDSFRDLQAHQMATLKAMQGALRATIDRFSPAAIRKRAESKGIFSRILPGAREAALWQAYEREFGGVAQGSAEAFVDVFAKEFRKAYEEQVSR